MRVTNKMLSNNYLNDMNTNLQNLKTLQQQMSTGKKFSKPSDDPFNVARSMQMHSQINTNTQYNKNITNVINWMDTTDTALGQLGNVFQSVREKVVSAGNAAYGSDERQKIKDEINQRVGQVAQILNTSFDGEYIFGGTRGATKPVNTIPDPNNTDNTKLIFSDKDDPTKELVAGDQQLINIDAKKKTEISQGVLVDYNVSATDVMNFNNGDTISKLLTRIVNHLDGNNDDGTSSDSTATSQLTNKDLSDLDKAMSQILKVRSEVGSKQNRMDSAKDQNEQANLDMTDILSKTEDIDITEKTMEYANMQTVYLASLQTSAKVLQPTLMDYMT